MALTEEVVAAAKEAKHWVYTQWKLRYHHGRYIEPLWLAYQRCRPTHFNEEWLGTSFLGRTLEDNTDYGAAIPRVIWCFWTGENALTPARKRSLQRIQAVQEGLEIRLVRPDDVPGLTVEGHPLLPEYEFLSLPHRSDYLRAYVLFHHGGGYTDIKVPRTNWLPVWDRLEGTDRWLAGYPEITQFMIPRPAPFGNALRRASRVTTGQAAYISRAGNPLMGELLAEMESRIQAKAESLRAHPANAYGTNQGYPLRWGEILAELVYALQFKYSERVLRDKRMLVKLRNHR